VRVGEISLFTPEDDMLLRDRVQSHGRHWKRIADEVEFSPPDAGAQNAPRLSGGAGAE
jgi:hypothetical protein